MAIKHSRYWALAAASVVVVIFGSAQATGALWRDEVAVAGGTLNSGTLDIKVVPTAPRSTTMSSQRSVRRTSGRTAPRRPRYLSATRATLLSTTGCKVRR
ncbi:hypothetical protein [Rhodococcus sovatensis]|uniref:MspA protein n=1 Tax=Rhodococcus sovatensis TaxID=1805840 RepID=A0ABZ2PE73_9NOCA